MSRAFECKKNFLRFSHADPKYLLVSIFKFYPMRIFRINFWVTYWGAYEDVLNGWQNTHFITQIYIITSPTDNRISSWVAKAVDGRARDVGSTLRQEFFLAHPPFILEVCPENKLLADIWYFSVYPMFIRYHLGMFSGGSVHTSKINVWVRRYIGGYLGKEGKMHDNNYINTKDVHEGI